MVVRAPEFLKDMPGGSGLLKAFAGQELRFSQDAMSMISAGGPGFGPIATIPMTICGLTDYRKEKVLLNVP